MNIRERDVMLARKGAIERAFPIHGFWQTIVKRLKLLKKKLKKLNKDHSSNIVAEAKEDRKALYQAQTLLHTRPLDIELQAIEKEKYLKFKRSSYLAEMYLQKRSKAIWLQLGDDNTSYFHSIIKHRKLKQAITQIKNDQGELKSDQDSIAQVFVDYYQDLLGKKAITRVPAHPIIFKRGNTLSTTEQMQLIKEFTEEEVKAAMFSIDKNKSPGPDGFGSGFYKAA
ncbi:uncharacterized protein LOC142175754 [Nicotiana tabacum]|uniref:Uncharacterized protein LOC142175754 n=1 Tax=Nicotiana tabacum TaxID=4097 RepID=A0AC58TNP1_TOBAC